MAEGLILPEATFTHRGRSPVSLLPKCVLRNAKDRRLISFHGSICFPFFLFTFILKIQRSTSKTGSAVACISAQADLSLGYKAKN